MEASNPAEPDVKVEEKPAAPAKRRRGMGHVCPPSNATHPKDRWDMYYVYMFIRRFTSLQDDIPSFLCIEDLESALLEEPGKVNYLLEQVVLRFILNLRPNTRNTSSELIPSTLLSVLHEIPKDKDRARERTVFWDWDADTNIMPLKDLEGGWWFASWDLKLRILRQLVDWQLVYSASIRDIIDTAWQSRVKPHKRRAEAPKPPPEPGSSGSRESLLVVPLGQDKDRTRFWVADSSPRVYTSTNPWKITQIFKCVCTTVQEYTQWIEKLRMEAPPEPEEGMQADQKHHLHWDLIYSMEARVDEVQAEIVRMEELRKKLAADGGRAAGNALQERRASLRVKAEETDHEEPEMADSVKSEHADGMSRATSDDMEVPPDTRETSASESRRPDTDDEQRDMKEEVNETHDAMEDSLEVDELQDDSSLNPGSDEEVDHRKGRKRRRKATPPLHKPSRASARKRPRREEPEKSNTNGTSVTSPVAAKANGTVTSPTEPLPQPVPPTLKVPKARQNTKFWFYDEVDGVPKKRPEMLDDPDAVLRRRKKAANDLAKQMAARSDDSTVKVEIKPE